MDLNYHKLPSKPSALIALALRDLDRVLQNPEYEVNWGRWHAPSVGDNLTCHVCLAGAVIAGTLGTDKELVRDPEYFDPDTRKKLLALDDFRTGDIENALTYLGLEMHMTPYLEEIGEERIEASLDDEVNNSIIGTVRWLEQLRHVLLERAL